MEKPLLVIFNIMQSDQFRGYFVNWKQSWLFPRADETERLLEKARFRDIQVSPSNQTTTLSDCESFAIFVKAVIMKPSLGYISDAMKKNNFLIQS